MGKFRKTVVGIALISFFLFSLNVALAQIGGYAIPSTYDIFGENVVSGDIISFSPVLNIHETTKIEGDDNMFGVVDTSPVVVFRIGVNKLPIVQSGEVFVNVTTINGSIKTGDIISSSQIEGKGQKFKAGGDYILGTALESFDGTLGSTTVSYSGDEYFVGTIKVLLNIGPYLDNRSNPRTPSTIFVRESGEIQTGLETIFRYITAALFALGTVFVVLKTFGPNIGKGIVSIGRNPLAKSSIQAMVVFNIILILAISVVSFIVSLLIIFLPI